MICGLYLKNFTQRHEEDKDTKKEELVTEPVEVTGEN
jgi:hypothetical protein